MAESPEMLRVLLVEDDEDDYILARDIFEEFKGPRVQLERLKKFDGALETMSENSHDVCMEDSRLGAYNGIELVRTVVERGCRSAVILLTGQVEHEIVLEAMKAGAADYLVKGRLDSGLLERSIRYALERKRSAD